MQAERLLASLADALWRGLPGLAAHELEALLRYTAHVGYEPSAGDVELWFERVQAGACPVAGSGCSAPEKGSRFCAFHRLAPAGLGSRELERELEARMLTTRLEKLRE